MVLVHCNIVQVVKDMNVLTFFLAFESFKCYTEIKLMSDITLMDISHHDDLFQVSNVRSKLHHTV